MDVTRDPGSQPWLDRAVRSLSRWPHGEVRSATAQRIGLDYACSDATILRVGARTAAGEVTFVLKQDSWADHDAVEVHLVLRACFQLVRRQRTEMIIGRDAIPALLWPS